VTIEAVRAARSVITLAQIKSDEAMAGFDLVRLPRLSVMSVPAGVDRRIRTLAGL
jgi:predicted RNA-binding protein with PUA-like domain